MPVHLNEACTPEGMRIYAVGDIHGCLDELRETVAWIDNDLASNPPDDYRIIFVGDYIDRGPCSKGVIGFLMGLDAADEHVICLRGNHDELLSRFFTEKQDFVSWYTSRTMGGDKTLGSFGVRVSPPSVFQGELLVETRAFAEVLLNPSHVAFLEKRPLGVTFGDYFFCHAGIRPGVALDQQSDDDLVWIRDDFLTHQGLFDKVVIHGHTSRLDVDVQPNRINIDTRCHATGRLTTLVLEGDQHRFFQTGPETNHG